VPLHAASADYDAGADSDAGRGDTLLELAKSRTAAAAGSIRATLIPCYTEGLDIPMANLTVTIDDEVLKRARLRATEQGTSVNAVVRDYLEQYAGTRSAQEQALVALLALSEQARSRRGRRKWTRDELHER
jgi:plasmid stability protein